MLWLWQLRDVALIGMATIISVVMILQFHTILPLVITITYTILSIRFEDTSILDFLSYACAFFITQSQVYHWDIRSEQERN